MIKKYKTLVKEKFMKPILIIKEEIIEILINHCCIDEYLECGGFLFGQIIDNDEYFKIYVDGIYYDSNERGTDISYYFSFISRIRAESWGIKNGYQLIGCYHSHGKYNAIFSEVDRNVLEKKWNSNKLVMIYSPSYNKLVCDFVTNSKTYSMKIFILNKFNEIIRLDKYLKTNKLKMKVKKR